MNQILFTDSGRNNNNKIDVKKIMVIFSIAIIVVALIIASIKIYGIYKKKSDAKNYAKPEIVITRADTETKEVALKVTCQDGIEYLTYTWNNEDANTVNLNNSTSFERIIEIPNNIMNNLKIEVVSAKGVSIQKTEIFERNLDATKPVIDSIEIVDKKLNVQASDEGGIKYLSYKWENEEEVRITPDENNNKTITAQIDIKRGTYKIEIKVVDIEDNEETVSKLITGVNQPEIQVMKFGDKVNIAVTHDKGFKRIEFRINGSLYVYDESYSKYDKNQTTVEFDFPLKEGENTIYVNAYSLEKTLPEESDENLENYAFKSFKGKSTYIP